MMQAGDDRTARETRSDIREAELMGHDIRGVLASALLGVEGLLESPDPALRHAGQRVWSSVTTAAMLCRRPETAMHAVERRPIPLSELIALAVRQVEGGAALNARIVTRIFLESRVRSQTAPLLLRIFFNLVRNAAEAVDRCGGGTVSLRLEPATSGVRVMIADSGPGFTPELCRLVEAGTASPVGTSHGEGIGLVSALRCAARIGGTLSLQPGGIALFLPDRVLSETFARIGTATAS